MHPVSGSDQPHGAFIFDQLGRPAHGGKSVQQRLQELDAMQARSRWPLAALPRAQILPALFARSISRTCGVVAQQH